jgi:hypothetical protein
MRPIIDRTPADDVFDVLVPRGHRECILSGARALRLRTLPRRSSTAPAEVDVILMTGNVLGLCWRLLSTHLVPHVPGKSAAWRDGRTAAFLHVECSLRECPHEEGSGEAEDWRAGFIFRREVEAMASRPASPQRGTVPIVGAQNKHGRYRQIAAVAVCIGCACHDLRACAGGCSWLRVDYGAEVGVCSACGSHVPRWDAGERTRQSTDELSGLLDELSGLLDDYVSAGGDSDTFMQAVQAIVTRQESAE